MDYAFAQRKGVFYLRYMDDIIILIETKKQYAQAKKRLFAQLKALRLKLSPHKTRMGLLTRGFHFLGVNFAVARTPQRETQVTISVHPRACRRAQDKVQALRDDAVNPAKIQRYLSQWATWWKSVIRLNKFMLIHSWLRYAEASLETSCLWYGRGLLVGTIYYYLTKNTINQNQEVAH